MNKYIWLLLVVVICACTNNKFTIHHENTIKQCRIVADSLMHHLSKNWHEYSRSYSTETESLYIGITDGSDSLKVVAEASKGSVIGDGIVFEKRPEIIKRHNLAIKRACGSDSLFVKKLTSNKALSVSFRISEENQHSLEDYGLTDDDI